MGSESLESKEGKELAFFNEALEYFGYASATEVELDSNSADETTSNTPNPLRDEMLDELDNLKEILVSELNFFKNETELNDKAFAEFISYYSRCPICGGFNHYKNLKELYYNEDKEQFRKELKDFMEFNSKKRKFKNLNVSFGIPCCVCYKLFFEKD